MAKGKLPVIIGKGLKKGIFGFRNRESGYNVCIVWLDKSKDYESGKEYDLENIDKIQTVLHFCDRESLELTIKVLNNILKDWKIKS